MIRHFAGDVCHVHVKDIRIRNCPSNGIKGHYSRGRRFLSECEIGLGDVPIQECLSSLAEVGYEGAYSLECGGDDDTVRRMIARVRAMIGQR